MTTAEAGWGGGTLAGDALGGLPGEGLALARARSGANSSSSSSSSSSAAATRLAGGADATLAGAVLAGDAFAGDCFVGCAKNFDGVTLSSSFLGVARFLRDIL